MAGYRIKVLAIIFDQCVESTVKSNQKRARANAAKLMYRALQ